MSLVSKSLVFRARYAGDEAIEALTDEVHKLNANASFDELDKYRETGTRGAHGSGVSPIDANPEKMRAQAAKKFVKKTASAAWLPTLMAVEGRANPAMPLMFIICVATAVSCLEILYFTAENFGEKTCANDDSKLCKKFSLQLPYSTVGVVGGALFFLMVFRTNASYDRW